jgi:RHS repeat-associated protein
MLKRIPITIPSLMVEVIVVTLFSVFSPLATYSQTRTISNLDGATPTSMTPGAPAGSYSSSGFEQINLQNRHFNFALPLLQVGGRGAAGYTITLRMANKWHLDHMITPNVFCSPPGGCDELPPTHTYIPTQTWWGRLEPGFGPGVLQGRVTGNGVRFISTQCINGHNKYGKSVSLITFTSADGTEYDFRDARYNGEPKETTPYCEVTSSVNRGNIFVTRDGSSATLILDTDMHDHDFILSSPGYFYPSGYMLLKDGTRYRFDEGKVSWIRDRNGNRVSFTYNEFGQVSTVTDSLNRQITFSYSRSNGTQSTFITFKGSRGVMRTIEIGTDRLHNVLRPDQTLRTYGELFPLDGEPSPGGGFIDSVQVSYVKLPDGRRYTFSYNSYGVLARVVLPTGGAIEYDYTTIIASRTDNKEFFMGLSERRVYPDGGGGSGFASKTTYEPQIGEPDYQSSATVKTYTYDASHNLALRSYVKHYFLGGTGLFGSGGGLKGREHRTEIFDTDGSTLLIRTDNTWVLRQPVSWPGAGAGLPGDDPRLTETITTMYDVSPNLVEKKTFSYEDQYNNQTDVYEYGYGAGAPGPLVRHTRTTYLTNNPNQGGIDYAADLNIHIRNLPVNVTVFDGNGAKVAETNYDYDAYGIEGFPGLRDTPLIVQHDSAFHHNYGTRGNLVQVSQVVNFGPNSTPTGHIHNKIQYDLAGNVAKMVDGRGNETLFDYNDRYGTPDGDARSNSAPSELGENRFTYAYPTGVVVAWNNPQFALVTQTQYDYYTGKPVDIEDPNKFTQSIYYEDALDRSTKIIRAVGTSYAAHTRYIYNDSAVAVDGNPARSIRTISDKTSNGESDSGDGLKSLVLYDGLGRARRSAVYEGETDEADTWLVTDTQFDALGRAWKVSNPFRLNSPDDASATSEWTTTEYDALSRVIRVTTPDGAHVDTAYAGNQVTVIDQAGKKRWSQTDPLGRLVKVIEDPGGQNLETTYLYDAMNNLRLVNQGEQRRWFAYDALSRLIRAKNPEQDTNSSLSYTDPVTDHNGWSIAYQYDENGNLTEKTDVRNITTTYTYDAFNRNTKVEYSSYANGSSIVERFYDGATNGKGRFWYEITYNKRWEKATDNLAYHQSKVAAYDPLGRPNSLSQGFQVLVGGAWQYKTSSIPRTYDLAGNVISQGYPSLRGVTYTYDAAGRLKSFKGSLGDWVERNYVSEIRYNSHGSIGREAYGTQTPLYLNLYYNNRLQLVDLRLGANPNDGNDRSHGGLTYYYGTNARNSGNPFANSADNNGNVLRHINTVPLAGGGQVVPQMDDYNYDALNRITSVTEQQQSQGGELSTIFTQAFSYDRWGNRTINVGATTIGIPGVTRRNFVIDTGTNRMTSVDGVGMTYDAAGNQTNDGGGDRYYDNENRMTKAVQGGQTHYYFYDASGKRVRRILNGSQTWGGQETWFVYGFDGELLAEYTYNQVSPPANSAVVKEYGYRNGKLLVVWDGTQAVEKKLKWLVTDHLGSTRMEVDRSGSLGGITRLDLLPFGEVLGNGVGIRSASIGYGGDSVRQKYTGYERDDETALDFAQARYYSSIQGRFTSPDMLFADQYEGDPQSWNLYTYVRNNPCSNSDPTGRETCYYRKNGSTIGCESDTRIKVDVDAGTLTFTPKKGKSEVYDLNTQVDAKFVTYGGGGATAEDFVAEMSLRAPALKQITTGAGVASTAIIALPIIGLAGGGTTLGLGTGVSALTASETAIGTLAAQLQFTGTTAARYALASRFVPLQTLASAILYGTRMADPQGAPGAIKIVQEIFVNGKKYNLEIIYREADKMILHFLYK